MTAKDFERKLREYYSKREKDALWQKIQERLAAEQDKDKITGHSPQEVL